MARMESKSIEVAPKEEQSTIDTFGKFGWSLVSSQEIFNKDSHQERRGDTIYNVTETTNYVKLVFNRDKDMPYYDKVSELENGYYATLNRKPYEDHKGLAAPIVLLVLSLIWAFASISVGAVSMIIVGVLCSTGFGFWLYKRIAHNKVAEKEYLEKKAEWEKELSLIIADVENYV